MKTLVVRYNGQIMGRLAEADIQGRATIVFEYDAEFIRSGIELSPFHLPIGPGLKSREGSTPCDRLPGLFEDSLPDTWGMRGLLDWFKKHHPSTPITELMKLSHVGQRGMGALTYEPEQAVDNPGNVELEAIYKQALVAEKEGVFSDLLAEIGSTAGGAQPKALIALTDDSKPRYWTGARDIPAGFEPWLVKFSVPREDLAWDGRIEYAYSLMARAAGIDMPATRLLKAEKTAHFAVKRFDSEGARRIHHHTVARLLQTMGSDLDYETYLKATFRLTQNHAEIVRAYKRGVFNVLACNDDDHGRNHGFLLRETGWTLSPAYDVTFRPLRERGLAVCGERINARVENLTTLAKRLGISNANMSEAFDAVRVALNQWPAFAEEAHIPKKHRDQIQASFR